jgi:septum formation protein
MKGTEAPPLVLASTSRYRAELLGRLRLRFERTAPGVDERQRPGEAARELAVRLARAKAAAIATQRPGAVVVGSDQVAELDGLALGKPGGRDAAIAQLQACSGREVLFHTAVCVARDAHCDAFLDLTRVRFRLLADAEIERYLDAEQPFDCAGSFKAEGLGACLFEAIHSEDPSALIGLPLIRLAASLRRHGYALP